MPDGSSSPESLGGKIAEAAAKLPEAAAKAIPQPKGPSERRLVGMLDAMGGGNTPTPRKSLEALARVNLDAPTRPLVSPEVPQAQVEKKTEYDISSKTPEPPANVNSSPENKQQEPTKTKQDFMVEFKKFGGKFSIEQTLESDKKAIQENSAHVKKSYSTAAVQNALNEYRKNPSQETAQKLFDTIDGESAKRQVRWDEARKACPHGIDPEECKECKKGATVPG